MPRSPRLPVLDGNTEEETEVKTPRVVRGGVLAPADIPLLKAALYCYLDQIVTQDGSDPRVSHIALMLHRLGRIAN